MWERNFGDGDAALENDSFGTAVLSRRTLFRGAMVSTIGACTANACGCSGTCGCSRSFAANAYTIDKVEPEENDIYAVAQNQPGPLRVLWVGPGVMEIKTGAARNGVYKDLFKAGNEVVAFDLRKPKAGNLRDAQKYASQQGWKLKFQQGDATKLNYPDESFDVVVSSLFLCQDFDPAVVVSEIRRVLKPGGRFGFYEHIEDIDKVVVGKVFGEASVIKVEAYPEMHNILAGVVQKV